MAPKGQPADELTLSDREVQLAIIALQCLEVDAKIQLDKFARTAQFTSLESARVTWSRIRSKLRAMGRASELKPKAANAAAENGHRSIAAHRNEENKDDTGRDGPEKKAIPRKRKAAHDGSEEQAGGAQGIPVEKRAKRTRAAKSVKTEKVEG